MLSLMLICEDFINKKARISCAVYSHAESNHGKQQVSMLFWTAGQVVAADENGDTVEAGPAKRMKVAAE